MKLADLFIDKSTGKLSQQRTWMNIAMLTITSVFVWYAYSLRLEEWMFWAYSIIAVFPNLISKWIKPGNCQGLRRDAGQGQLLLLGRGLSDHSCAG